MIVKAAKYYLIGMAVYKSTKFVAKKVREWQDNRSEQT